MAGRGTDIVLGGNPDFMVAEEGIISDPLHPEFDPDIFKERLSYHKKRCAEEHQKVIEAGGLHVLGTERHESRRIDNQLVHHRRRFTTPLSHIHKRATDPFRLRLRRCFEATT